MAPAARDEAAQFDTGERCIACRATNTTVKEGKVHCGTCFHVADLAELRSAKLTDEQISSSHDEILRP